MKSHSDESKIKRGKIGCIVAVFVLVIFLIFFKLCYSIVINDLKQVLEGNQNWAEKPLKKQNDDTLKRKPLEYTFTDSINLIYNKLDSIDLFRKNIFDTKKSLNKTFVVNDIESCWYFNPDKSFEITLFGFLKFGEVRRMMVIKGNDSFESFENFEEKWFNNQIDAEFTNVNFDRYDDFVMYSQEKSGNGGRFYDVYTFFIKERTFNYSQELSGGNLNIDPKTKTMSTFWKSGVGWNITKKFTFRGDGYIYHTEFTENQVKAIESQDYLITTYKKYKYKDLLETKIDTTVFEGW